MPLARYEVDILDDAGNKLVGEDVTIEVKLEIAGQPRAALKSDRAGLVSMGNPFTSNTGVAAFHVVGGAYQITFTSATLGTRPLRYVAIGRGAETDITGLQPKGDWSGAVTYDTGDLVAFGGNTFASNADDNLNNEPPSAAESDSFWTFIPATPGAAGSAAVTGTSETSNALEIGEKTFTIEEDEPRGWATGARLRLSSDANPDRDYGSGIVTGYDSVYDSLVLEIDYVNPLAVAGPHADWTFNLDGERGPAGADGVNPGALYTFEVATAAPPSAGGIRANNADLSAATALYVSDVNRSGDNLAAWIQDLAPGGKSVLNSIALTDPATETQATFQVSSIVDESGHTTLNVTAHDGATAIAAGAISLQREISGPDGSGLAEVVNDPTPQLGGVLDANGNRIDMAEGGGLGDADIDEYGVLTIGAGGNSFAIDGSESIAGIAAVAAGTQITLRFQSSRTLEHDMYDFILPGGDDIAVEAGAIGTFHQFDADSWELINYQHADGVRGEVFEWTPPQAATESGGDITLDAENGKTLLRTRTLAGNETLLDPVNMPVGATVYFDVDPNGNTLSFDSGFIAPLPDIEFRSLVWITQRSSGVFVAGVAHEELS